MSDYVFSEGGSEIVTSTTADLTTGARRRHGDRVIAVGLCVLGSGYQPIGESKNIRKAPFGSFEYHRRQMEKLQREQERTGKKYLF
ncbi:MAG: hypothetical protein ACFFDN_24440 [Candidatus Hodarchaeota archaeon]